MKRYLTLFFLMITSLALCAYPEGAINNIDGSVLGWDNASQTWRPIAVDANGKLSSNDSSVVASISVDTSNIESYLKETDGENTVTITDLINSIGTDTKDIKNDLEIDDKTVTELVNGIGTDTSNIMSTLKVSAGGFNYSAIDRLIVITSDIEDLTKTAQPKYFKTARLSSIAANTLTQISPISSGYGSIRVFVEIRAIDPDAEFYVGFDNTLDDTNGRPVKGRILLSMPTTQALYIYHANASAIDVQQTEGWR